MFPPVLCVKDNIESLWYVSKKIIEAVDSRGSATEYAIGLCGGRSVEILLKTFESVFSRQSIIFRRNAHFYTVDERVLPDGHKDRNSAFLERILFSRLIENDLIHPSQIHRFGFVPDHNEKSCKNYHASLSKYGGRFVVTVVSVASDGHIAGVFPHHPVIELQYPGFVMFSNSPKPPDNRMTATLPLLVGTKLTVILILGADKEALFRRVLDPAVSIQEMPAKSLTSSENALIVTDSSPTTGL